MTAPTTGDELPAQLPAEYHRVDIDLARPDTIPWVVGCLACQLRQDLAAGRAGDQSALPWVSELGEHFWYDHKIELIQHRGSSQLGQLVALTGPFTRTEHGVRMRVLAANSPIRGQLTVQRYTTAEQARAALAHYAGATDMFDSVAYVTREVTVTEWAPPPQ